MVTYAEQILASETMSYEERVIAINSTPSLKRNVLSRSAKKDQLNSLGMNRTPRDRDALLDKLYGPEDAGSYPRS